MGNALTLGLYSPGNGLTLYASVPSVGLAAGQATAVAIPLHVGYAAGAATVAGVTQLVYQSVGGANGVASVVAIGLSNRGNGLAQGVATVLANNSLVVGTASGSATASGAGASYTRFAPFLLWPGYSSDGSEITIPLVDIDPILDAATADATTGDWRKIMQALCMTASAYYQTLADSNEGALLTARARVFYNYSARHAVFGNTLKRTAVYQVHIDHETGDIANEP